MRHAVSMLLICLIACQCVGFGWLHGWQVEEWREMQWERVEAGLVTEEAQVLEIADLEALSWENAREFDYQGLRYDLVAKHRLPNGHWQLKCILDSKETELKANYLALLSDSTQDPLAPATGTWLKLIRVDYVASPDQAGSDLFSQNCTFSLVDWGLHAAPELAAMDRPPSWS